jgi:hypothetical protein
MPAIAPPLAIPPEDLHTLGRWSRSSGIRAALAERAKILLLAAQGTSNTEIAHQVGCSRPTVILWRRRYAQGGLDGLLDRPRSGRPQTVRRGRRAEILAVTLSPPPEHLGVTHWSSRLLADQLGVSHNTVARVWAEHDLKPWRLETFKFSTDPQLEAKVRDVGLYLDPPERAIVVCVDEKSQIQALARTAPNLPLRPGSPERRTHDAGPRQSRGMHQMPEHVCRWNLAPGQDQRSRVTPGYDRGPRTHRDESRLCRGPDPRRHPARDDHPIRSVGGGDRPRHRPVL